ncbi:MAG: IS5 family transposase, partial [Clostridiaceae bacterium]|nr:IS5 family transposase [Clostridiaceae bacterium]
MNRRRSKQIAFHDTPNGFQGTRIFPDNRWVRLSKIVPWDLVDEIYARNFEDRTNGNVAIDSRIAFGALIIKEELCLSDEETVCMICENPHCQYFLGLSEFTDAAPFDSSKMVAFRRRFPLEAVAQINEAILRAQSEEDEAPRDRDDDTDNHGTLILDATCAPADVHYPTDASVLNDARLLSERLIDELHDPSEGRPKPRTYRKKARKSYLLLARSKRPGYRLIRHTIRAQLQFIHRNLGHIERLSERHPLTAKQERELAVVMQVHDQQREMYDLRKRQVPNRIVSISQPHVRPIVRGKRSARVEFGAKVAMSLEDGYARIEKLSWDAFNESQTLQDSCERYRERHGYYP